MSESDEDKIEQPVGAGDPIDGEATADATQSDAEAEATEPKDGSGTQPTDAGEAGAAPLASSASADGDELPEDEELTPELVEEEAIRGDFMLRWASIFLALLFGFSQMSDTRTLVHVRSGDQMRANGFLPSATDSLSYMMEGETASNVSWLFDHVVSAVYSAGGDTGLTIFKALMAGLVAYLLSLISVRGMPTWWSSICCVLAVGACSIDFLPVTDLATLVGMVVVLLLLHRHSEGSTTGLLWKLPLTIAVWSNFDPHAYVGVFAIGLFAVGTQLQRSRSENQGDGPVVDASQLWKATAFSVIALLVNPAPLASVLSVVTTYGVEYPVMAEMRPLTDASMLVDGRTEYYPVWLPAVWQGFEFAYVSGLSLILIAVIVLLISRSRQDLPWAVTLLGFSLLTAIAMHELPAAALVAAVAAGTAAQRWYGRSFRQEYTVNTSEVLFSRGGRAVTVLSFAALGFFAVADRLPTRSPIGMGFEADLKTTMDSLGEQFAELPDDARVLNTRLNQGDMLIWHGLQSFVDSRVRLFGRYENEKSPIHQFDKMRRSITGAPAGPTGNNPDTNSTADAQPLSGADIAATPPAAGGQPGIPPGAQPSQPPAQKYDPEWKQRLAELGVTHAMLRMSPPGVPAYIMALRLFRSPDWVVTHRGPSALFFSVVTDKTNPPAPWDIVKTAFRTSEAEDAKQLEFAREPDFYRKYLYASRRTMSAPLRDAQHYLTIDSGRPPEEIFQITSAVANEPENDEYAKVLGGTLAGPLMAVRNANKAISLDPQDAQAHRLLGEAYNRLNGAEQAIAAALGGSNLDATRNMQAVLALRQAVTIDPTVAETWEGLASLYQQRGRTGVAADCLEKYLDIVEARTELDDELEVELSRLYELLRTWNDRRKEVQTQVDEILARDMPEDPQVHAEQKMALARQLSDQGHIGIALKILNDNVDLLRPQRPDSELLRGQLLMETGELQEGSEVLSKLAAAIRENPQSPAFVQLPWHNPVAVSKLAEADYNSAAETWGEQLGLFADLKRSPELPRLLMRSLPLVPEVEAQMSNKVSVWPMFHLQDCGVPVSRVPNEEYEPTFMRAMANIESGGVANAKFILEGLVSNGGDHSLRPLAAIYLRQLSENATELIAAAAFNPWEEMDFPETDGEGETKESTDGEKSDEGSEQNESTEDAKDDNGVSKSEQNESDQKQ